LPRVDLQPKSAQKYLAKELKMTDTTRQKWLRTAAIFVILFGPVVSMAAHPLTAGLNGMFVDLAFWPFDGIPTLEAPATRLFSAVAGGLTVGWGMMIYLVATKLYPIQPQLAGSIILTSVLTWFVTDSLGSAVAGAPANALINLVFLVIFLVPILSTKHKPASI
jgi:hypothetical protein